MYRVIIIDDEPIIVEGLTKTVDWEKRNCIIEGTAGNGQEGMELIREKKPDIVISDISMPQMDGLSMIAALRSEFPNMQITILTGFRDFDYAQEAIRLGVCRFLLKPSKMAEIDEALDQMVIRLQEDAKYHQENVDNQEYPADANSEAGADGEAGVDKRTEEKNTASCFIVKNALTYIENNYKERLTLLDVADHVYVSQWHLSKLLNKHTGQNFSEILNHVRIEHAKKLLEDPSLRIGDISEEVGFLDLAHFSRVFKKQEGVSANEFRNKNLS